MCATFVANADDVATLAGLLSRWVVMTRGEPGCRNVDLLASTTQAATFRVIEKWVDGDAMQRHLDSPATAELATEIVPVLAEAPSFELYDAVSAHDLE